MTRDRPDLRDRDQHHSWRQVYHALDVDTTAHEASMSSRVQCDFETSDTETDESEAETLVADGGTGYVRCVRCIEGGPRVCARGRALALLYSETPLSVLDTLDITHSNRFLGCHPHAVTQSVSTNREEIASDTPRPRVGHIGHGRRHRGKPPLNPVSHRRHWTWQTAPGGSNP